MIDISVGHYFYFPSITCLFSLFSSRFIKITRQMIFTNFQLRKAEIKGRPQYSYYFLTGQSYQIIPGKDSPYWISKFNFLKAIFRFIGAVKV